MRFYAYGSNELPTLLLIHGGGSCYRYFERHAEILRDRFHVIVPLLDGHYGEEKREFVSVKAQADKIVEYIDEKCNGSVYAIAGIALGAQIALEVCAKKNIKKVIIESSILYEKSDMASKCKSYIRVKFARRHERSLLKKMYKRAEYSNRHLNEMLDVLDAVSIDNEMNYKKSYYSYNIPENISDVGADFMFIYGELEDKHVIEDMKRAAAEIDNVTLLEVKKGNAGDFSCISPERYVDKITDFFSRDNIEDERKISTEHSQGEGYTLLTTP